jgi:carbamoyl-phosphate synthase large subunit
MRILVTAVGGDIGYGVGKILRKSGIAEFTVGCDIHREHPGDLYFNECEIVPMASSSEYLGALVRIARAHRIDLIVPASEPELRLLHEKGLLTEIDGISVLMPNEKSMDVGFDKLRTANFLRANGLPYPWTISVTDGPPLFLPCVYKGRFDAGSRGIEIITDLNQTSLASLPSDGIWQELLEPPEEEYTCGLYRSSFGEVRYIIFKRKLVAGSTKFGVVCRRQPQIETLLSSLAHHLELIGSINVQLRLTECGPIIFEINPRFSSTLVFRHLLGFEDVIWSIMERFGKPLAPYVPPNEGVSFFKGTDELILPKALQ